MMQLKEYSTFPLISEGVVAVLLHMMLHMQLRTKTTTAAVRTVMFRMNRAEVAGRRGVQPMTMSYQKTGGEVTAIRGKAEMMTSMIDMMVRRMIDMMAAMVDVMESMMTDMVATTKGMMTKMMTDMMAAMIGMLTGMTAETAGVMSDQGAAGGIMKATEVVEGIDHIIKCRFCCLCSKLYDSRRFRVEQFCTCTLS